MYAETGILFPFFQNLDQEAQLLEDFCNYHSASHSLTSAISEYDLGGEGDLFKAPEPVIEELPVSTISCFKPSDIELFQSEQLLSELLKDLLEEAARDSPFPGGLTGEENSLPCGQFQKSLSSGCLSSMEPSFMDFSGIDFGSVYGMRRAYSEEDIKIGKGSLKPSFFLWKSLGNGSENCNKNTNQSSSLERSLIITPEERKEKLSRYRIKKTKRNFGRKIKYACRKALADSQPRIRGRFARTQESEIPKRRCSD